MKGEGKRKGIGQYGSRKGKRTEWRRVRDDTKEKKMNGKERRDEKR